MIHFNFSLQIFHLNIVKKALAAIALLIALLIAILIAIPLWSGTAFAAENDELMVLEKYKYSDYKGYVSEDRGGLTIAAFFASWCVFCAEEFPVFADANLDYQEAGQCVDFLGVNIQDTKTAALGFMNKTGVNFNTIMIDRVGVSKLFIRGVPTTMFYANGSLVDMIVGPVDRRTLDAYVQAYAGQTC